MSKKYPNCYQIARKSTCLTQEQAAEQLGLSAESMKQYELGKRVPPDRVVLGMMELYGCPWLALEHRKRTDLLGVLPAAELRPLPQASLALRNRLHDAMDRLDDLLRIAEDDRIDDTERPVFDGIVADLWGTLTAIYQVIYSPDGIKKERPESDPSKRSSPQALRRESDCKVYYTRDPRKSKSQFSAGREVISR